jgi:hypothetical protein
MRDKSQHLYAIKKISLAEPVTFGQGDTVDFTSSQPSLSFDPHITAYPVQKINEIAYLLAPHIVPRLFMMEVQSKIDNPHLLQGYTVYPLRIQNSPHNQMLVIAQKPKEISLASGEARGFFQMHKNVAEYLVKPFVSLLRDFEQLNLTHRAIHPERITFEDLSFRHLALGPGFLTPPGFLQPACYEPLQTCFSEPTARGAGHPSYDLYALGVTILSLYKDSKFLQRLSSSEDNKKRLSEGSYFFFVEKQIFSDRIGELLKGLICDEIHQRWTLDDLESWADFNKVHARYRPPQKSATKPFSYQGTDYDSPPLLIHQIGLDWTGIQDIIYTEAFRVWMRRNSGKHEQGDGIEEAKVAASRTEASVRHDAILSYSLMALDPENPLYFRGLVYALDGIGDHLAAYFHDTKMRSDAAALLSSKAALFWLSLRGQKSPQVMRFNKLYQETSGFLSKRGMGFGIERCLYELNPHLPCQSAMMNHVTVYERTDMLAALNHYAQHHQNQLAPKLPIDRHLVAYAATHYDFIKDDFLNALPDEKAPKEQKIIACIRFLSLIEKNTSPPPLKDLYYWVHDLSLQSLAVYRSKNRREKIKKMLESHRSVCPFDRLLHLIDNAAEKKVDMDEFMEAKKHHMYTVHKTKEWQFKLDNIRSVSQDICDNFSILLSALGSLFIATLYLFV